MDSTVLKSDTSRSAKTFSSFPKFSILKFFPCHLCDCVFICVYIYIEGDIYIYIYVCVCVCVCVYIYIYIY